MLPFTIISYILHNTRFTTDVILISTYNFPIHPGQLYPNSPTPQRSKPGQVLSWLFQVDNWLFSPPFTHQMMSAVESMDSSTYMTHIACTHDHNCYQSSAMLYRKEMPIKKEHWLIMLKQVSAICCSSMSHKLPIEIHVSENSTFITLVCMNTTSLQSSLPSWLCFVYYDTMI